ncbi:hypothetical protein ACH5RR_006147 [Cinchona calisaya]|uniref:LOB domain-containing protein n=1 Tax=Cinchona calisaya TaxID=153742 RepID=A0ABD3ANH5_9GENT
MVNGACAACKHQRKRCRPNCLLAKYFPQEKMEDFLNVQRIFGVNNVKQILLSVNNEDDRNITAQTLVMEAQFRRDNPVYGSIAMKNQLEAENEALRRELKLVQKHLKFWRKVAEEHIQMKLIEAQLDKCPLSLSAPDFDGDVGEGSNSQ